MRSDVLLSGVLATEDLPVTTDWVPTVGLHFVAFNWGGIRLNFTAVSPMSSPFAYSLRGISY